MNKIFLSLTLIILSINLGHTQINIFRAQIISENKKTPIIGGTVYFEVLQKGAVTDLNGSVEIYDIPDGEQLLNISFLGFQSIDTVLLFPLNRDSLIFYLRRTGEELEEITISASRSTRTIKNIPTRIEYISSEELTEKAVMNPANISMVLRESTGIQMQQTSLSSGNTNIRIQGLDGRYTQLLKDGFPLYGGFSGGLSIVQIPPLDLEQFEIIKGSSSTLYGGGAIAGLVNMVSKIPKENPELNLMLSQTHALGSTANIFYSKRNNKFGYIVYGMGNYQRPYDPEDDGFSNIPLTKSFTFNPKLFYYPSDKTTLWLGVNLAYDFRIGGDMQKIKYEENGIHQYSEENKSKRASTQAVYESVLSNGKSISVKNTISFFNRNLNVPDYTFDGSQWNTYTEASYKKQNDKTEWILGANVYSSSFIENVDSLNRDQNDITGGIFVNNIHNLSEKWILETGLRTDYAQDWGFFPLPRISLLFKANTHFSSRIGGGLGYKIPDMFTEEAEFINYRNILPIDKEKLNAERSYGVNLDINYSAFILDKVSLSFNQLFYFTIISDGLLLDSLPSDFYEFRNANGNIISKGAETNIKLSFFNFRWFVNYAFIDASLNYLPGNPQKPLTAKHNAGSVLMYESEKWRIGYETYYTGRQLLSDGTKTPDFWTMGLLVMRNLKWGSIYTNFENFTDVRQSRFSPLVLPPHEYPIFPEIYAPTDGFIFSIGLILKPFSN